MSTADLDALLKLLSDDTKAMEAVGANFQRTFPKSDHFRLAATIWCVPAVACVGGCVGDVGGDGRGRGAAARSKSGQPRSVRTRVRAPVVSVSVAFAVSVTVSVSLSVRVRARRVRACARIFASTQETASTLTQGVCSLLIQERAIELTQRVFGFYILFDLYKSESPGTNPFLPVLLDQVCATFGVLVPCATHTHTLTHSLTLSLSHTHTHRVHGQATKHDLAPCERRLIQHLLAYPPKDLPKKSPRELMRQPAESAPPAPDVQALQQVCVCVCVCVCV